MASILDDVRRAVAAAQNEKIETFEVPRVQSIRVRYNCSVDFDDLNKWTKRAASRTKRDEIDGFKFACLVLANTCVGIEAKNSETGEFELLLDDKGEPMTFTSAAFQDSIGAMGGTLDAVKTLYIADGHVITTAKIINELAGYGDSVIFGGDDDPLA